MAGRGDSRVALARSVTFGDLAFEDCLVEIAGQNLTVGADGIIGADVFERFRIGVDGRAGILQLTPYDDAARDGSQASVPAVGIGKLLLVKARVQGGSRGIVPGGYGRCVHDGLAAVPSHVPGGGTRGGDAGRARSDWRAHFAPDRCRSTWAAWH